MGKFLKGMLIYALVVLIIFAAVLFIFSRYLASYEKSQPISAVNEYLGSISEEKVSELSKPIVESLSDLSDGSYVTGKLLDNIKNSTPVRGKSESADTLVYYLKSGNSYIEKLTLSKGEDCGFGYNSWKVSGEEIYPDSFVNSVSLTVPPEYTVSVDGKVLGSEYITDDKVEYDILKGFYKSKDFSCPYLVTYFTGSLLNGAEITVKDGSGNTVPLENLTEDYYADNCTTQEKQDITEFTNNYVEAYVRLTSNADGNYQLNFYHLTQYVLNNSDLHNRLRELMKSVSFNMSHGDEITDITINHIMNCGKGNYMVDVTYTYNTTGQGKVKTTNENNERLMLRQSSTGAYQAQYLVTY